MSARVYFMIRVKDCKDVSIMSPQVELQWRRQNINKQHVTIADETFTDYSFLSYYHNTKLNNYLKRRYRIRHWIPMFIGTPCSFNTILKLQYNYYYYFSSTDTNLSEVYETNVAPTSASSYPTLKMHFQSQTSLRKVWGTLCQKICGKNE